MYTLYISLQEKTKELTNRMRKKANSAFKHKIDKEKQVKGFMSLCLGFKQYRQHCTMYNTQVVRCSP